MSNTHLLPILCSEDQMLIIQKITNASRQEIIHTIRISRISVEEIIACLKKSALKMSPYTGKRNTANPGKIA